MAHWISGVASPLVTVPEPEPSMDTTNEVDAVPVPDRLSVGAAPGALELAVNIAVSAMAELGRKLTASVQLDPTWMVTPVQLDAALKSVDPEMLIELTVSGALPTLLMAKFWLLLTPVCWVPKAILTEGVSAIWGSNCPVPLLEFTSWSVSTNGTATLGP